MPLDSFAHERIHHQIQFHQFLIQLCTEYSLSLFKNGQCWPFFVFSTLNIKFVPYKNLPMSGFKLWTSAIGIDHSANWAITTTQILTLYGDVSLCADLLFDWLWFKLGSRSFVYFNVSNASVHSMHHNVAVICSVIRICGKSFKILVPGVKFRCRHKAWGSTTSCEVSL